MTYVPRFATFRYAFAVAQNVARNTGIRQRVKIDRTGYGPRYRVVPVNEPA